MVSGFPLVKNTAQRIVFPILDADGDPVGGATALDSEYSINGGVFTDCTNEATNITSGGANTGIYYLDLVAAETNGDVICIQVKTTTTGAKTTVLVFYTAAQNLDTVDTNVDSIVAKLPTNYIMGSSVLTAKDDEIDAIKAKTDIIGASVALETGGNLATIVGKLPTNKIMGSSVVTDKDDEIDAIKAKTDNLPADPADDSDIDAQLATITGYLDTEIAAILADTNELQTDWVNGGRLDLLIDAIKAKTDNLPADPADDSDIDTQLAAIQADLDNPNQYKATGFSTHSAADVWAVATRALTDKAGFSLSAAGIDAIIDDVVEGTLTLRQAVRLFLSVLAGKSSGGGTTTITFRDNADSKNRINATVDADGNRTTITLDGT